MENSSPDKLASRQPRLLLPVGLFIFFYAAVLSIANSIRVHSEAAQIDLGFALPLVGWFIGLYLVNNAIKTHLPNRDPWIFPCVFGLIGWGLLTIWRLSPALGLKQLAWYLIGSLIFIIGLGINDLILNLKRYKYLWLVLGLVLIALTFIIGVNPGGSGPKLWLKVLGLYIQPSEPLKLLLIVYLSAFFADQIRPNVPLFSAILPTILVTGLAGLLLIGQRDLGTASIFIGLYALMLTITTHRRRFLWLIPLLAIVAGTVGYFAFDIIRARIDIWLNPWVDTGGASYQLTQAKIAIAAGGLFGTGPGLGSPQLVPVAVSDFIFSAIGEETGLFGTTALMLFGLLIWMRGFSIAQTAKTTFGRYLAFGISAYLALQTFLIISGNLGLVPLTGVTLPFLSYGGSSLVTNMVCALILLRISTESSPMPLPEKIRRPYKAIAAGLLLLFTGLVLKNTLISIVDQEKLLARPENPRWAVYDRYSPRGDILTQSGEELAVTLGNPGNFTREVIYTDLSNTIGYAQGLYGQAGLEKSLYSVLRGYAGIDFGTLWWSERLYNQPPAGLDVKLNLNLDLQKTADSLLAGKKGSAVLLNAKTGEIYVLSSHPNFDANTLSETWDSLMQSKDAPLLNRPTQGNYQIGTLASTLAMSSYWSEPGSDYSVPNLPLRLDEPCYRAMQAANLSLGGLQFGCSSTADKIISNLQSDDLLKMMGDFGLFSSPSIALDVAVPSEVPVISDNSEFASQAQKILVSPLQMALVASAITNNGVQPSPKLVNSYRNVNGDWIAFGNGGEEKTILSSLVAGKIRELFKSGSQALWFQNGHAEPVPGQEITWYIGGTTSDWKGVPLAIAIAIEGDDPELTQTIGAKLLNLSN